MQSELGEFLSTLLPYAFGRAAKKAFLRNKSHPRRRSLLAIFTCTGQEHVVMCGGERNYIEHWFETFKDRLRSFDCYFPTYDLESARNFCLAFGFLYNQCRWHQTMKGPPSGGEGGLKAWIGVLI